MVKTDRNTRFQEATSDTSYVVSCSGSVEVYVDSSRRHRRAGFLNGKLDGELQQTAYRIHFSVANKNRYFRSAKRSVRWVFGLLNPAAVSGIGCRGDQHEVELVWSSKKKKAKLYWNKCMISNLWRRQEGSEDFEFSWKSRSGETFQIVSRSEVNRQTMVEYDLLVGGVSFFQLPKARDMRSKHHVEDDRSPINDESGRPRERSSDDTDQSDCQSDPFVLPPPSGSLGFRLSMAGLGSSTSFESGDQIQDELHSELFTPVLEPLRLQLTSYLPQTEEMVSRAIINAFFVDSNSLRSYDSSSSERTRERQVTDPYQVEADRIMEAHLWANAGVDDVISHQQSEELALCFLQKQVDEIFVHIRNEELSSDEAARILLSVATVLGLNFAGPGIPRDTVILTGLDSKTTKNELYLSLTEYGEVVGTAIANGHSQFAFCRFVKLESVTRACDAYKSGSFSVGKSKPAVVPLGEDFADGMVASNRSQTSDRQEEDAESVSSPEPSSIPTPHLMAPLSFEDPLLLDSPVSVVQYITNSVDDVWKNEKKRKQDGLCYLTSSSEDSACRGAPDVNLEWAL